MPAISTLMARPESGTSPLSSLLPTKQAPSTGQHTTMIPFLAYRPSYLATSTRVPNIGLLLGPPPTWTILLMKSIPAWATQIRVAMREPLGWMAMLTRVSDYSLVVVIMSRTPYLGTPAYLGLRVIKTSLQNIC